MSAKSSHSVGKSIGHYHYFCVHPQLIEQDQPIEGVDTLSDPCVWLDYLATIFRGLQNLLSRLDDAYRRSRLNSTSVDQVQQQHQAEVNSLAESAQICLDDCLRVVTVHVWPVIGRALEHYATRGRCMERCCRTIRFVVRSFSVNLRDLLPDIANKVCALSSPLSIWLAW